MITRTNCHCGGEGQGLMGSNDRGPDQIFEETR